MTVLVDPLRQIWHYLPYRMVERRKEKSKRNQPLADNPATLVSHASAARLAAICCLLMSFLWVRRIDTTVLIQIAAPVRFQDSLVHELLAQTRFELVEALPLSHRSTDQNL